ncbi:MAG: FtsQ-type POTRA domain-containing protein, partial [Deltaproteobacteria bacterium]|nr:FtsQ-type POTRA domain-containing protein [Deltaproteobacteria bacterium]
MRRSFKAKIATKKNRLKRQSGPMFRETLKVSAVIVIATAIAFCMVYAYNFIIIDPYFQLDRASIRGCERVTEKEVIELAGIAPSMNILTMNLDRIKKRIRTNPWVEDVFAGRELPNRLVVEIVERKAAAIIKKNEKLYLADWNGEIFKGYEKGDSVDLPLLTGFYENEKVKADLLNKGFKLLRYLSRNRTFPGIENVSEVIGEEMYGFTIITNEGLLIELGFGNYSEKFTKLNIVM